MSNDNPKARADLEFLPARKGNNQVIVVRDALGLVGDVVLADSGVVLLSLLDGTRSVRDIQVELMRRQGGVLISSADVEQMIRQFDQSFLLDNERYRAARQRIVDDFAALEFRPPSHAQFAYPETAAELAPWLDSILDQRSQPEQSVPNTITALVAPHIDLRVGQPVYAAAYAMLTGTRPDRIVILGTGHNLEDGLISLSTKDFVTPLGRAKTDGEVVRALARASGAAVSPDDFAHRKEHSIEFQVMFLQHVLRCPDITIVPILCGSFQNFFERYNRAAEIPGVGSLLSQLREIVLDSRRKTLLVAGVDLSHVGPKFGDRFSATGYEPEVRQHDRFLLDALCEQQVEAFWEEERRTDARYRVCGFSALACLLELLPPGRGEVLGYEFWNEQATQSGVSFAAVAFRPHETE